MPSKVPHRTTIELLNPPHEVEAGARMSLQLSVTCAEGCDLRGAPILLTTDPAGESIIVDAAPVDDTVAITCVAPTHVGEHVWRIGVNQHENELGVHGPEFVVATFTTLPHTCSAAVWDVPFPAVAGRPFTVKVGIKCASSCSLAGQTVVVIDETGRPTGEGTLGAEPWPGTTALYVADVTMVAPEAIGRWSWTVSFQQETAGLPPHSAVVTPCNLTTERAPDHCVTVTLSDRQTGTALPDANVRVGPYRAKTNLSGVAVLAVPAGAYELTAWKYGYEDARANAIEVSDDLSVTLGLTSVDVSASPDDERVWM